MQNYLVVGALTENSNEIIQTFTKLTKASGCNIVESCFNVLGQQLSIMLFLSGSWNEIAKMENCLKKLEEKLENPILLQRTNLGNLDGQAMPYAVDVVGIDRPGIILEITDFILNSNLSIEGMFSKTYKASQTGAEMFSLHMTVNMPPDTFIAAIRGDFIDFCDLLNLDAIIEPIK